MAEKHLSTLADNVQGNALALITDLDHKLTLESVQSLSDGDLARFHGVVHHWREIAASELVRRSETMPTPMSFRGKKLGYFPAGGEA